MLVYPYTKCLGIISDLPDYYHCIKLLKSLENM